MARTSADETRQNSGRIIAFSDGVVAMPVSRPVKIAKLGATSAPHF